MSINPEKLSGLSKKDREMMGFKVNPEEETSERVINVEEAQQMAEAEKPYRDIVNEKNYSPDHEGHIITSGQNQAEWESELRKNISLSEKIARKVGLSKEPEYTDEERRARAERDLSIQGIRTVEEDRLRSEDALQEKMEMRQKAESERPEKERAQREAEKRREEAVKAAVRHGAPFKHSRVGRGGAGFIASSAEIEHAKKELLPELMSKADTLIATVDAKIEQLDPSLEADKFLQKNLVAWRSEIEVAKVDVLKNGPYGSAKKIEKVLDTVEGRLRELSPQKPEKSKSGETIH